MPPRVIVIFPGEAAVTRDVTITRLAATIVLERTDGWSAQWARCEVLRSVATIVDLDPRLAAAAAKPEAARPAPELPPAPMTEPETRPVIARMLETGITSDAPP